MLLIPTTHKDAAGNLGRFTQAQFEMWRAVIERTRVERRPAGDYLLAGRLYPTCGVKFRGRYGMVEDRTTHYECQERTNRNVLAADRKCVDANIVAAEIEAAVWKTVRDSLTTPEMLANVVATSSVGSGVDGMEQIKAMSVQIEKLELELVQEFRQLSKMGYNASISAKMLSEKKAGLDAAKTACGRLRPRTIQGVRRARGKTGRPDC
ncbi:hypothetical protein ABLG96_10250 [Nakamurella sp. A5-74]|uniref:Recombinase zinc beta ribbon domain-containing protein n=1 Tax=Nakamurella sp. A5-74 TaxID=3158264 RepID=A0AAU8DUA9_9ACTN